MKEQLLNLTDTSRKYTLDVAAAMPEGKYNFKPVDEVWNFRELLHHIAYGIEWWEANYVLGLETDWAPPATGKNKEEVMAYLEKAYDSLQVVIKTQPMTESAVKGVHSALDHITHHRGQAVLHLRLNGIEPPAYTY
ncbi:hypothetical protein HHL16_04395 [Pseudoflavitalea sp. G-6-1-2]|uniref:DinB family protein n=1 Tax=Pseudoflavitalea sp. G-6-1-2 TaxID=2728841 RepID=UPI00146C299F|nr:DinB family protein [Pseudoflavitalea sp. G-6-1-2]NML20099.1 hypothetical protein [Pseudoflavitalea sp. G-6-1-2]